MIEFKQLVADIEEVTPVEWAGPMPLILLGAGIMRGS